LVSGEAGRVRVTGNGSEMSIEDSAVSDGGIYRCTASNGIDDDSAVVIVTVKGTPHENTSSISFSESPLTALPIF